MLKLQHHDRALALYLDVMGSNLAFNFLFLYFKERFLIEILGGSATQLICYEKKLGVKHASLLYFTSLLYVMRMRES